VLCGKNKFKEKNFLILLFLLGTSFTIAQNDTNQTHGTIKIGKPKDGKVYIKAAMNFNKYDLSKLNAYVDLNIIYPPFPGVEGYTFPFNYNKYFNEKFKTKKIDLRGKASDTVRIEIKVLANGKVYLKDKSFSTMIKDIPTTYDEKVNGYELSRLQLNCLDFLKEIKTWEPAYVTIPKKGKFKKQTVIKPEITQLQASGILTIVFSSVSFED